jgi:hypothetical protein
MKLMQELEAEQNASSYYEVRASMNLHTGWLQKTIYFHH